MHNKLLLNWHPKHEVLQNDSSTVPWRARLIDMATGMLYDEDLAIANLTTDDIVQYSLENFNTAPNGSQIIFTMHYHCWDKISGTAFELTQVRTFDFSVRAFLD